MSKTEHPILRRHRMITQGLKPEVGNTIVLSAANTLAAIGATGNHRLAAAATAGRPGLQEMLSKASQTARAFTPRRPTFSQEVA
jgi:hypothetical protein